MKFTSIMGQMSPASMDALANAVKKAFSSIKWEPIQYSSRVTCYGYSWLMTEEERNTAAQIIGEQDIFIPTRLVLTPNDARVYGTYKKVDAGDVFIDILDVLDGDRCDFTPITEVPYNGEPVTVIFKVY